MFCCSVVLVLLYYNLGLCNLCVSHGTIMLAFSSFRAGLKLPKARFVFYHYFLRAAMGDDRWKEAIRGNGRFTNTQTEALALVLLENYCESWTFDYLVKNQRSNFQTEYDQNVQAEGAPRRQREDTKMSIVDIILPDIEFDLDADEANGDLVLLRHSGSRDDIQRFDNAKETRLSTQSEMCYDAQLDRKYTSSELEAIRQIQNPKERKTALERQGTRYRIYTGGNHHGSNRVFDSKAKQQCRGWSNQVHLKMASLIQSMNEEAVQVKNTRAVFEKAYRELASEMIQNKDNENSSDKFEVSLAVLYGMNLTAVNTVSQV